MFSDFRNGVAIPTQFNTKESPESMDICLEEFGGPTGMTRTSFLLVA
jgi:hypothetical protein